MRTVDVTWDVPIVREAVGSQPAQPLAKSEIADTEVSLAVVADNGTVGNFTKLANIKPDQMQTVEHDVPDGTYKLRFIVMDTYGQKGKPLDVTVVVKSAPPGVVTNVKVTVA